jgi:ribokinase
LRDRAARVSVIGSYAKALVVTTDRIPVAGETLIGRDYRETFGGKGSDMAVQAARLGAQVSYIGVVGDDSFGREFGELLSAEGIDASGLRVSSERPTGIGLILKDVAGANVIVVEMGANELLSRADIDTAATTLGAGDVAIAPLEIPIEIGLYGLDVAHRAGVRTILNPAPAVDLRGRDLSMVDVITPNQTEARLLVGLRPDDPTDDVEIASRLLAQGVGAVVVTRGGEGARVFEAPHAPGQPVSDITVPAFAIELVDSNGAGDSFNAGLAVGLGEGRTLAGAARFAAAVSGLCCEHWETVPSYQDRGTVDAFIAARAA